MRQRLPLAGDDSGSAIVEFVLLVGPLMVPLVWLIVAGFEVQRTAFAVAEGSRQAGRAYVTGANAADANKRALFAANLALDDQGLPKIAAADLTIVAPENICRGGAVTVTVHARSALPFMPKKYATVAVSSSHTETIDELRDLPACP